MYFSSYLVYGTSGWELPLLQTLQCNALANSDVQPKRAALNIFSSKHWLVYGIFYFLGTEHSADPPAYLTKNMSEDTARGKGAIGPRAVFCRRGGNS